MHAAAHDPHTPDTPLVVTGPPRTGGRIRRVSAILTIGALPLIAAACAKPAGPTDIGAGAGGAATSSASPTASSGAGGAPASSASATVSSDPSSTSSGTGGSSTSPSKESSMGVGLPDSLKGSAFTSKSVTGRQAIKGSPLTISFDAGGTRSGLNAGCNSMGGTPRITADTLQVNGIISTEMACEGGGGAIMKQESWYAKWLTEGVGYTVDGTTLTLEGAGVTVVFERSGDADEGPASSSGNPDQGTSSGEMTTQAEPGPVESGRTPIPGATIQPGNLGSAIPIPPTTDK